MKKLLLLLWGGVFVGMGLAPADAAQSCAPIAGLTYAQGCPYRNQNNSCGPSALACNLTHHVYFVAFDLAGTPLTPVIHSGEPWCFKPDGSGLGCGSAFTIAKGDFLKAYNGANTAALAHKSRILASLLKDRRRCGKVPVVVKAKVAIAAPEPGAITEQIYTFEVDTGKPCGHYRICQPIQEGSCSNIQLIKGYTCTQID